MLPPVTSELKLFISSLVKSREPFSPITVSSVMMITIIIIIKFIDSLFRETNYQPVKQYFMM